MITKLQDITPRTALAIQARQIVHYGPHYPGGQEALAAHMARLTKPLPLDEPQDIIAINRCIPRGGAIESILEAANAGFCWLPKVYEDDNST